MYPISSGLAARSKASGCISSVHFSGSPKCASARVRISVISRSVIPGPGLMPTTQCNNDAFIVNIKPNGCDTIGDDPSPMHEARRKPRYLHAETGRPYPGGRLDQLPLYRQGPTAHARSCD